MRVTSCEEKKTLPLYAILPARSAKNITLYRNMPLFLRTIASRAAPVLRGHTVSQSANIYTKPAKEKIGAMVSLL